MSSFGFDIVDNPALGIIFGDNDTDIGEPIGNPAPKVIVPDPVGTPTISDVGAVDMRVMSCNVQNTPDLSRTKVKGSGKAVSGKFTVGGFQELGEHGQDRHDVLEGLGKDYAMTSHGNADVQTQIAYLVNRLTPGTGGYVQAVPGGQPYPNPPRGWVWQDFTPDHGPAFMFVDTHMVNRAWNPVPDPHKALRKKNWETHWNHMRNWLEQHADAKPIIVVGDFNRVAFPLPKGFKVLAGSGGIDKILISLPQGFKVKGGITTHISTPSDHDAIVRQIQLERKRAS